MVNQLRTLLLNMLPEAVGTTPGEEYVPKDFRPVNLPAELQRASQALFGAGADRAGKNIQLLRITGYLHASPLAEYVTADDQRLTYKVDRPGDVFDQFGATVTNAAAFVGWSGLPTFPAPGRAYGVWVVTTNGSGGFVVTAGGSLSGTVIVTTAGDSIPLPNSNLSLVVAHNAAGEWVTSLLVAPAYNFAAAAQNGDPDAVFRPDRSAAEKKWYATWNDSPAAAMRAGAFALALAARINDIMTGTAY